MTPKFSFGSSDKKSDHSSRRPPLSSSPFTSGFVTRHDEEIEEPSLEHEKEDVRSLHRPSYRAVPHEIEDPAQPDHEAPSTTPLKRRRLLHPPPSNTEQIIISSSPSSHESPPTTPPPAASASPAAPSTPQPFHPTLPSTHPRFHFTLPTHSSPPPPSTKPSFLFAQPPSTSPHPAALSSPHRRGQKYAPGGLASTVRDWVFETSQEAGRGSRKEDCDHVLRVVDVKSTDNIGEGMTVLEAEAGLPGRKWILIGRPRIKPGEDGDRSSLGMGVKVGIKKPVWELISPDEGTWHVGVEWTVMADQRMGSSER